MNKYYEAYDKRYKQVHENNLSWSSNNPTKKVIDTLNKYLSERDIKILEIGCGEGRDARYLLGLGYNVLATDISPEAISYCIEKDSNHASSYKVLNACNDDSSIDTFDFIYSIACLHMLVDDTDRKRYLTFIKNHLKKNGVGLILTLGDGKKEMSSDITEAFNDSERVHGETGKKLNIATTSCRVVSFKYLFQELESCGFEVVESGITSAEPDFREIMYVIVR